MGRDGRSDREGGDRDLEARGTGAGRVADYGQLGVVDTEAAWLGHEELPWQREHDVAVLRAVRRAFAGVAGDDL